MAEKFVHQGAVSPDATYLRTAVCIYSGNTKMYDTTYKYWNTEKQNELNFKYMQQDCTCPECARMRADRARLRAALERDQNDDGLRAMGWA